MRPTRYAVVLSIRSTTCILLGSRHLRIFPRPRPSPAQELLQRSCKSTAPPKQAFSEMAFSGSWTPTETPHSTELLMVKIRRFHSEDWPVTSLYMAIGMALAPQKPAYIDPLRANGYWTLSAMGPRAASTS